MRDKKKFLAFTCISLFKGKRGKRFSPHQQRQILISEICDMMVYKMRTLATHGQMERVQSFFFSRNIHWKSMPEKISQVELWYGLNAQIWGKNRLVHYISCKFIFANCKYWDVWRMFYLWHCNINLAFIELVMMWFNTDHPTERLNLGPIRCCYKANKYRKLRSFTSWNGKVVFVWIVCYTW